MSIPKFTGEVSLRKTETRYPVIQRDLWLVRGDVVPQLPPLDGGGNGGGCRPGLGPCSPDGWKTLWHADCSSEQIRCKWVCS